jgi:hypothetical protein
MIASTVAIVDAVHAAGICYLTWFWLRTLVVGGAP